jgi:hypothetical protein
MTFKKGQSGNPNGRPQKSRALTAILEAEGSKTEVMSDGKHVARKRLMARNLWDAVTTGKMKFVGNEAEIVLTPDDIIALIQFLYKHIDGPPVQNLDVTSGGEKLKGYTVLSPDDWDKTDEGK